jgi:hypothetical protein
MGVRKIYTIKDNKIVSVTEVKPIELKPAEVKRDKLQQSKQPRQKKIYTKEMLQEMAKKLADKVDKFRADNGIIKK